MFSIYTKPCYFKSSISSKSTCSLNNQNEIKDSIILILIILFRLFTHYSPDKRFGCGVRTGATVVLYHVHLICKLGQVSVDFMLKINYHTSFDFCRSTTRNSWEKSSTIRWEKSSTIRLQDSTLDGFFSAVAGWNSDTHQGIRGPNFAPVSSS